MTTRTLEEQFDSLLFATCPTETQEPFFWKWNNHGREVLLDWAKRIGQETEERVRGEMRDKLQEQKQEYLSKLSTKHVCKQGEQDKILLIRANEMDIADLIIS